MRRRFIWEILTIFSILQAMNMPYAGTNSSEYMKAERKRVKNKDYKFVARLPNGLLLRDDDGDAIRFNSKVAADAYSADYAKGP